MKRMLTMVAALVLVLCTFVTGAMADTTMYVRTGNGKTLNVRSEPNTGDNVIYRFQYGQEVIVAYHLGNGWSCVRLAGAFDQDGYVMTKFLVNEKPGKYVPSSADAELAQPATSKESFTMDQLNEAHLTPKRFRLVYPDESRPASLALIEAMKDGRPFLEPCPPLIVNRPDAGCKRLRIRIPAWLAL